jgi:hypothetical protein
MHSRTQQTPDQDPPEMSLEVGQKTVQEDDNQSQQASLLYPNPPEVTVQSKKQRKVIRFILKLLQ